MLDAVLPERLLHCTAPDLVDLALTRLPAGRDHHTVVHVTPALAQRAWGHRPAAWSDGVTLADLELTLRLDRPVTGARLVHAADRAHVEISADRDHVTLRLDRLDGPELIVLT